MADFASFLDGGGFEDALSTFENTWDTYGDNDKTQDEILTVLNKQVERRENIRDTLQEMVSQDISFQDLDAVFATPQYQMLQRLTDGKEDDFLILRMTENEIGMTQLLEQVTQEISVLNQTRLGLGNQLTLGGEQEGFEQSAIYQAANIKREELWKMNERIEPQIETTTAEQEQNLDTLEYPYEVYEDNGGGLTLFVFDKENSEKVIYAQSGYEFTQGKLAEDITALKAGSDPLSWDGNENNPQGLYASFSEFENALIVDNGGIYPERMGGAGQVEFAKEIESRQEMSNTTPIRDNTIELNGETYTFDMFENGYIAYDYKYPNGYDGEIIVQSTLTNEKGEKFVGEWAYNNDGDFYDTPPISFQTEKKTLGERLKELAFGKEKMEPIDSYQFKTSYDQRDIEIWKKEHREEYAEHGVDVDKEIDFDDVFNSEKYERLERANDLTDNKTHDTKEKTLLERADDLMSTPDQPYKRTYDPNTNTDTLKIEGKNYTIQKNNYKTIFHDADYTNRSIKGILQDEKGVNFIAQWNDNNNKEDALNSPPYTLQPQEITIEIQGKEYTTKRDELEIVKDEKSKELNVKATVQDEEKRNFIGEWAFKITEEISLESSPLSFEPQEIALANEKNAKKEKPTPDQEQARKALEREGGMYLNKNENQTQKQYTPYFTRAGNYNLDIVSRTEERAPGEEKDSAGLKVAPGMGGYVGVSEKGEVRLIYKQQMDKEVVAKIDASIEKGEKIKISMSMSKEGKAEVKFPSKEQEKSREQTRNKGIER